MRSRVARLLLSLWSFSLLGQEIEIPDKPLIRQTEAQPKPKPPAKKTPAKKPKAAKAEPAALQEPATPSAAPAQATPFAFGSTCLARTRYLKEPRRVISWRARLAEYRPELAEQKQLQASLSIPQSVYAQCRIYQVSGNNSFGLRRSTFKPVLLINGPGFAKAILGRETQTGEWLKTAEGEAMVFKFQEAELTFWPIQQPGTYSNQLVLGYQGGTLVSSAKNQARFSLPYSPGGILALGFSDHEAVGVFRFPLTEAVVPLKGIRLGNELLLEADQERQLALTYLRNDATHSPGVVGLEPPGILRIKVKLDEPQQLEVGFIAKGREPIGLPFDLHGESLLSITVSGNSLRDLSAAVPDLAKILKASAEKPDREVVALLPELDQAYAKSRLELYLWPPSTQRPGGVVFTEWVGVLRRTFVQAATLHLACHEAPVPSN